MGNEQINSTIHISRSTFIILPIGREQLGLVFDPEAQTRRELVAERLWAEQQSAFLNLQSSIASRLLTFLCVLGVLCEKPHSALLTSRHWLQ